MPPSLHDISKYLFHAPEKEQAAHEQHSNGDDGYRYALPGCLSSSEQSPSEPLDYADHRIHAVQHTPRLGNQARRVYYRRSIQPELHQEGVPGVIAVMPSMT